MKFKFYSPRNLVALMGLLFAFTASQSAGAVDIVITGEVTMPTGAFVGLTPVGTQVSGPITVRDAALAAGLIGISDIQNIAVRVGGFCFASVPDPNNPPVFPCGQTPASSLVPIQSVDAAAITGTSGRLGGNLAITAFSPSFNVSIPILFNLDAGTFSANGGTLGTVSGTSIVNAPVVAAPEISTTPAAGSTLAFGNVVVGSAATTRTITIANTGTGPLTVNSITSTGGPADLVVTNNCGASVAAASMCTVTATLTPATAGMVNANINVSTNDADEGSLNFSVTANIQNPAALSSNTTMGAPLMLNSVAIGGTSTGTITVSNTGGAAVTLGTVAMPTAPFSLTANDNCSGQSLAGGGTCTIEVEFSPVAAGMFTSNFNLQSANMSLTTTLYVASSTLDPAATPSADPLMIASAMVNNTSMGVLTITNSGDAALTISGLSGLVAPFSVTSENCIAVPVAPAMSCNITVTFAPTAVGPATGSLSIASNDPATPLVVGVLATGTLELLPNVMVTPAALVFPTPLLIGAMAVDTLTVSNMGTADLEINNIGINPDPVVHFSAANNCVSPLAPMASCTITVTFAPTAAGQLTATITVDTNDPDTQQTVVMLSGTGVTPEPNIMLGAAMLDLGVETIGNSTMGAVTVTNTGTANLNISSVTIPAGDYSQTNNCGLAPLAPLGTCVVTVTFAPTINTTITDVLTIVSNDPDSMMSTVNLTGRGVLAPEPNIASSVTSLNLGAGLFGVVRNGSVQISNNGNAPLSITAVTISGADLTEFVSGGTCVGTLALATNCTVTVQFTPGAPEGAKSAVLNIASDDADTPNLAIALTGVAQMPLPVIGVAPASIAFAATVVNGTASATVTVSNTGTGQLTVSSVAVAGAPYSVSADMCTGTPVAVNGSCNISVNFMPTAEGPFAGTLTVNSDDSTTPAATVALSGTGTALPVQDIAVDVMSLALGSVLFGDSGMLMLTVTNVGDADLTIAGATIAPAGEFTAATACGVLAPAATCTVNVTYTPTIEGSVTATLTIASDDPDTPALAVALSGTGITPEPEIDVSPTALAYGSLVAGTNATRNVTVSNGGMADLTIGSITVSGANQALFSQTNNCTTVAMGASCTVMVTFAPVAVGDATATLTIVSNDADEGSVDVSLAGSATPVPMPMISVPASLDLGDVTAGTTGTGIITVSNTGTANLVISAVNVQGTNAADFAQTNACATVAAGGSCDITVVFTPATQGAATANVVITSNDNANPTSTVAVSANALVPVAQLSATSLDLGSVRIGESNSATLTVTNPGNTPLVVSGVALGGANTAGYSLANGCSTVAPAATCTISVTYRPGAQGSSTAAITFTTNDPALASATVVLTATGAPMEEVVVSVSSEGGNGSFGLFELAALVLFAVLIRRRLQIRSLLLAVGALAVSMSPVVFADDHEGSVSKSGYWYAGAAFGSSDGQADLGSIERGIETAGVTVTSLNIDDTDSGYKLFAGYQATEYLGIEVGYVDLGKAGIGLQLGDVTLAELPLISRAVSGNLSLLGSGVFGSVVVKQSIGEMLGVFARAGLVSWEVDSSIGGTTSAGALMIDETESGTDFMFGIGAEAWFGQAKKIGIRGEWERYELGNQDAEFLSLGAMFRF